MTATHVPPISPASGWPRPTAAQSLGWLALAGAAWLVAAHTGPAGLPLVPLVVAPVLEEVLFRTGLQRGLRTAGLGPWVAVVLTAAAFAAAHLLLRGPGPLAAATAVPALVVGWAHERTRRLAPCVALHSLFNLAWMAGLSSRFTGLS